MKYVRVKFYFVGLILFCCVFDSKIESYVGGQYWHVVLCTMTDTQHVTHVRQAALHVSVNVMSSLDMGHICCALSWDYTQPVICRHHATGEYFTRISPYIGLWQRFLSVDLSTNFDSHQSWFISLTKEM